MKQVKIDLDLDLTESISMNPWMPRAVFASVKRTIESLHPKAKFTVGRSALIDHRAWREFAATYKPPEPEEPFQIGRPRDGHTLARVDSRRAAIKPPTDTRTAATLDRSAQLSKRDLRGDSFVLSATIVASDIPHTASVFMQFGSSTLAKTQINTRTLVVAIQAVAAELRGFRKEASGDGTDTGLEQLIADYERAADDLEDAYDEAAKTVLNLPPYDELVGE